MTRLHRLSPVSLLISAAVLIAGCGTTGLTPIDGAATCGGHPQPDMCRQALEAVVAELGERGDGGRIRIEPVNCAHGTCWTTAYVTPAAGGPDQQLSIDWSANGKISVGYVVPG